MHGRVRPNHQVIAQFDALKRETIDDHSAFQRYSLAQMDHDSVAQIDARRHKDKAETPLQQEALQDATRQPDKPSAADTHQEAKRHGTINPGIHAP